MSAIQHPPGQIGQSPRQEDEPCHRGPLDEVVTESVGRVAGIGPGPDLDQPNEQKDPDDQREEPEPKTEISPIEPDRPVYEALRADVDVRPVHLSDGRCARVDARIEIRALVRSHPFGVSDAPRRSISSDDETLAPRNGESGDLGTQVWRGYAGSARGSEEMGLDEEHRARIEHRARYRRQ
jgi:hypothetical protein